MTMDERFQERGVYWSFAFSIWEGGSVTIGSKCDIMVV